MIIAKKTPFEQAVDYLAELKPQLLSLPKYITEITQEIRLRAGQPITLELSGNHGNQRIRLAEIVTFEQINGCIREFCGFSVHSHEKQFREGWLTLAGGHRAGFGGTAVLRDGKVENIKDISSVNLRIARQFIDCGSELYSKVFGRAWEDFSGLLIIGKPMSAKTTVLRDLCRMISDKYKVALIDERAELAAVHGGVPSLDVGSNTDVLNNFPKAAGIMTALRSLSPEFVLCDEVGWEIDELTAVANSGVKMIITVHGDGDYCYLKNSKRVNSLLNSGAFSHIAILGSGKNIGKTEFFGKTGEYNNDTSVCGNISGRTRDGGRTVFFTPIESERGVSS